MKIKDLREILRDLPDDMEIVMSKDAEGNGFSPLCDYNTNMIYEPDNTWSGEVYDREYFEDEGEDALKHFDSQPKALVLWPAN